MRFNATLFHTIWEDIQALGAVDPVTGLQLPDAAHEEHRRGGSGWREFELTFLPIENFMINFNLGLLDTAYTDAAGPGQTSGHLALDDGHGVPAGARYDLQPSASSTRRISSNGGSLISRLDYNYQAQFWRSEPFLRHERVSTAFRRARTKAATRRS